jgi:hypothetical protein
MALSFDEKLKIQDIIESLLTGLDDSALAFNDKLSMQDELENAFAKLNEQIDLQPDAAQQNQKLADLIAGKFNGEEPERFIKIIKAITDEIQAVSPVIQPTEKYIELKKAA